jgi:uncharacterized membrane protein YGL010W
MSLLVEKLVQYAAYHRDRRNIATHFVGIPAIVIGIEAALARPSGNVAAFAFLPVSLPVSPAALLTIAVVIFYFAVDRRYGTFMTFFFSLAAWAGVAIGRQSTGVWLLASAFLFIGGWAIQFLGHAFEGKKPAFIDDLVGLLIGPLFIVAEAGFSLGMRTDLRDEIERRAGPVRSGAAAAE